MLDQILEEPVLPIFGDVVQHVLVEGVDLPGISALLQEFGDYFTGQVLRQAGAGPEEWRVLIVILDFHYFLDFGVGQYLQDLGPVLGPQSLVELHGELLDHDSNYYE